MKIFRRLSQLLIMSVLVLLSSQTYATVYNLSEYAWAYDSDHNGVDTTDIITDNSLSFSGYTLAEFTTNNGTDLSDGGTFTDYSYLYNTDLGIYNVGTLTGTVNSSGFAEFSTTSTMTWYDSNTNTAILGLSIVEGNSSLTVNGSTLYIGQIYLSLEITSVQSGYFYIYIDGEWVDFATLLADSSNTLTFSTITTSGVPTNDIDSTVDATLSSYAGVGSISDYIYGTAGTNKVDLTEATQGDKIIYTTGNDGYVDVNSSAAPLPEPGMLSLMGLAFLGLAGLQRRRKMQSGTDVKLN